MARMDPDALWPRELARLDHMSLKSDAMQWWTSSPFITNSVIQLFQTLHALKAAQLAYNT